MKTNLVVAVSALALLGGCAVQEPPLVQTPTTARPQPRPVALPANGAIFQAASYRPMFQDAMPVQVGDTVQITIQENSSTSQSEQTTNTRSSSQTSNITAGLQLPFLPGGLASGLGGTNYNANGSANNTGKGNSQVATTFISSITVTVIDVLANGNLVVSGEKQVRINSDTESIRLSGVLNPRDIGSDRTVSSLKLSDARIEQQTKGNNRLYNEPGWLSRFFMSLMPI
ncbi:flagellar basal body L-ring protein FlgH [Chromobacterium sp. IIBBL 290-4]|uniref:flagellar basal body L-ring protein FlgH n=1 Tax=Chromobacterium sp. IIBBL 290-4 TaxID=2953890 RepID=UPI0020B7AB8E|nr:flagellar basal body L-ring protein FlgH [Chromobacterium sp. IIBBL 290-4]UTH73841.1 flagellar basal body L-ring protein FlgH [Chromobacterium sp. IIBBL 290-4]